MLSNANPPLPNDKNKEVYSFAAKPKAVDGKKEKDLDPKPQMFV
jgi:hypothetical protein